MKCKDRHLFFNCDHGMWGDASVQAARSATINAEHATEDCNKLTQQIAQTLNDMASEIESLKARVAALEAKG